MGRKWASQGAGGFTGIREICTRIKAKEVVGLEVEVSEWDVVSQGSRGQGVTPKHQRCYWNKQKQMLEEGKQVRAIDFCGTLSVFRRCGQLKVSGDKIFLM